MMKFSADSAVGGTFDVRSCRGCRRFYRICKERSLLQTVNLCHRVKQQKVNTHHSHRYVKREQIHGSFECGSVQEGFLWFLLLVSGFQYFA
jgi:hypothetical protein